jgi:hypothetical protein
LISLRKDSLVQLSDGRQLAYAGSQAHSFLKNKGKIITIVPFGGDYKSFALSWEFRGG